MDLTDRSLKKVETPPGTFAQNSTFWEEGYRDTCIAAPVTRDNRKGTSLMFLHYKKVFYGIDVSRCMGSTTTCTMTQLTNFDHHEGYKKTMACAAYTYEDSAGMIKYTMFVSQREATKIVSLDFSTAVRIKDATVEQKVVAQATGQSIDGPKPSFLRFQGLGIYSPKWGKPEEPFILISGGGELRIFNHARSHARTLARTEDGAVAAIGEYAFSGRTKLYKTDLHFHVKCSDVHTHVLPTLVQWKIPGDVMYAQENKRITLNSGDSTTEWLFKAYKKTADTLNGVFEKTSFCSRQTEIGTTYFYEHCCTLKFSRALPNMLWDTQTVETELF